MIMMKMMKQMMMIDFIILRCKRQDKENNRTIFFKWKNLQKCEQEKKKKERKDLGLGEIEKEEKRDAELVSWERI